MLFIIWKSLNSAHSALNSAEFFSSEQRWFRENQRWSALKQSWSALMFFMFSESALKNVKTMKQRCSALITSGTSPRGITSLNFKGLEVYNRNDPEFIVQRTGSLESNWLAFTVLRTYSLKSKNMKLQATVLSRTKTFPLHAQKSCRNHSIEAK